MAPENLHILLVDDHDESLSILARLLEKCGYAVKTARDYREAIAAASGDRFDLLISDVGLPDRSGLELMQVLHAAQGLKGIALSGFTDDTDMRASEAAGFARHLNKPVVFSELTAAIEAVLNWCPPQADGPHTGWRGTN